MSTIQPPRATTFERFTDRSFLLTLVGLAGVAKFIDAGNVLAEKMLVWIGCVFAFTFPEKMKDAVALLVAVRGLWTVPTGTPSDPVNITTPPGQPAEVTETGGEPDK